LVDNVTQLYRTGVALPVTPIGDDTLRVLHVSDLHLNPAGFDLEETIARQFDVDVVVDTGDLTDWGSVPETQLLDRLGRLGRPLVYVRGNHDSPQVQAAVDRLPNTTVLDGRPADVAGLRLLGTGDPRFTPDQETRRAPAEEDEQVRETGRRLQATAADERPPPDLVAVHDPIAAEPLAGQVPLVLAGHRHEREVSERDGTVLMVQGSTGGAGLRGLRNEEPTPLTCSVLYLDRGTHRLLAYDDITLGGLGLASATVERHLPPGAPTSVPPPRPSPTSAPAGTPIPIPIPIPTPSPSPAPTLVPPAPLPVSTAPRP
jgi:predicted MPP superfamily phosphohydrolase